MAPEHPYQWQLYKHLLYKSDHVTLQTQNTGICLHVYVRNAVFTSIARVQAVKINLTKSPYL
jgi:hypothetical protein